MRLLASSCVIVVGLEISYGLSVISQRLSPPTHHRFSSTRILASIQNEEPQAVSGMSNDSQRKVPDMKAYAKGYTTVFEEQSCRECSVSMGKIPSDLKGTYYRSVPSMFSAGSIVPPKTSIVQPKQPPVPDGQDMSRMQLHPFEADGGVLAVTFGTDDKVTSRFRFVRTIAFTAERKKGMKTYKGMDSTRALGSSLASGLGNDLPLPLFRHHLQPGLNKQRRNTSNSRTIFWGKRLLTLWEGGQPYKLDSIALSTEGKSRLGGAIKREEDAFGGKMVYDAITNTALFYGLEQGAKTSEIAFYEFNDKFRLIDGGRQLVDIPGYALINDFAATENYGLFIVPDVEVDGVQFLLSKDPGKSLKLKETDATLYLIPRSGKAVPKLSLRIPFDGSVEANLIFCNAYEEAGTITVDLIRSNGSNKKDTIEWPWGSSIEEYQNAASKKSLWRYTIDRKSGDVTKTVLCNDHIIFPNINPAVSTRKHRFIYANVGSLGDSVAPPQGIIKFDCETMDKSVWFPKEYEFCGEPIFVARDSSNSEDDGYILSSLYNGKDEESELCVFDAQSIEKGPVARIPLGIGVPHGLHGCFASGDDANWDYDTILRRAKLADKMEAQGNRWNEVKSDFSGLGLRLDDMEEYFGDFFS